MPAAQQGRHPGVRARRRVNAHAVSDWAVLLGFALIAAMFWIADGSSPKARAGTRAAAPEDKAESHRGRSASTPSEIPLRGWKDILLRVYANVDEHRILALAAGMTFYSLLAIFPALAALVAIYGLFADPATITAHLDTLSGFMPGGAIDVARDQLTRVASKGGQALGWTFLIGLAISLWSANAAMKSLFDTLNIVYGEKEKRGLIKLNLVSLLFTLAAIAFALVALGAVVVLPVALNYLGLSGSTDLLVRAGRWPALFVVLTLALAIIYRYGPSRRMPRWRWISWGSALAAALWLAASALFSWYTANFGSYNQTYGSLGAAIGFMTWLWISAIAVLIGAELDAETEHQTAHDTTTGRAKPMGARGAQMADTLGPAQAA
ncbi:YihY/virulence factor BrkB family protein [Bradyrhizobium sp. ARR65]|uniref:YihY/virulence factor BrkB family protein n=1 Tax=Bradyrhizobium sp. ARR65 TaxID=1040989 RepID=UPI001FD96EAD|nr:YihY/virulence factor BrkB family protein [Bradyrhizobium sp. ARR65]